MKKHLLFLLLVLYVLGDLGYTFVQTYQLPLEGDVPSIVLPGPECRQVLSDPFGWAVLTRDEVYVAPNRFFAQAAMGGYMKLMPLLLQRLSLDPISSVYAACGLFAVGVQLLLLYVLGVYITGRYQLNTRSPWLAVALLVPLFQVAGYNDQMGILDHSITYTFFYAFPMTLLLLLLLPFYLAARRGQPLRLSWPRCLALVGLMVVLAFNGAIITGVVAVLVFGIVLYWGRRQWQAGTRQLPDWLAAVRRAPRLPVVLLGIFTLLCLYSLYIGLNELESNTHTLPLWERYTRIPSGLFWQFRKLGLPVLVLAIGANTWLLRRWVPASPDSRRILQMLNWLALFALVYLLLLPLGGYRDYRPLIVRRDSVMPLILGAMLVYGMSTHFLLHALPMRLRRWYIVGVVLVSAIYINADALHPLDNNTCERQGLERLAQATEPVVRVSAECTVMSWWRTNDPKYSETNAQLLEYWGITKGKKLYYHEGW